MQLGVVFDSSTCFQLPNGGTRSPDVAWVSDDRWNALTKEQKQKFPPLAPDFVLELMSPSDRRQDLQEKMLEYQRSGVRLGWLINPSAQEIEIYSSAQCVLLQSPTVVSGDPVLPGFTLDLSLIWS